MEESNDVLMYFFCLMILGFICGCLSALADTSIDTCQKAVEPIRNVLAKQAEEQGITIEELIDSLNNK